MRAVASDKVFAAGFQGVVLQWNGNTWTDISTGLTSILRTVAVSPAGDPWVGGDGGKILRRTGNAWDDVSLPTGEEVSGLVVDSPTAAWAVTSDEGSVYRWDGARWALASGAFDTRDLRSAWSAGPGTVWSVGDGGLVVHVSGGVATKVDVGVTADLRDVWGAAPDDIWVVGAAGTMLRYDGHKWAPVTTPETGTLRRVWGTSSSDVWAVGDHGILRWDAAAQQWNLAYATSGLTGIGGTATQVWFVGASGILTYEEDQFVGIPGPGSNPQLSAVWFAGDGDGWVASARNRLGRFDGVHAPSLTVSARTTGSGGWAATTSMPSAAQRCTGTAAPGPSSWASPGPTPSPAVARATCGLWAPTA